MIFGPDFHGEEKINSNDFGDPLTFSAPSAGHSFRGSRKMRLHRLTITSTLKRATSILKWLSFCVLTLFILIALLSSISHALTPSLSSSYPRPEPDEQLRGGGQQQGLSVSCRACGQEEPPLALSLQGWKVCVVVYAPTSYLPAWERKLGAARENKQTIRYGLSREREREDRRGGGAAGYVRS